MDERKNQNIVKLCTFTYDGGKRIVGDEEVVKEGK